VSLDGLYKKKSFSGGGFNESDLVKLKNGGTLLPNGVIVYPTGQVDDSGFKGF
jgi:hypothetical protein